MNSTNLHFLQDILLKEYFFWLWIIARQMVIGSFRQLISIWQIGFTDRPTF